MANTGLEKFEKQLEGLKQAPRQAIEEGHNFIMGMIPVYTGTYQDGVKVKHDAKGSEIYVSTQSMEAAAARNAGGADYVYENMHGSGPEGPYPLRIEQYGRPSKRKPSGQGAWAATRAVVEANLKARLKG